jgi:hypothetical protein
MPQYTTYLTVEICALLRCYAALRGSSLPTFQNCIISQKSADLMCIAVEAWNHAYLLMVCERGSVVKGKIVRTVEAVWYCLQGKSALWSHLSHYQELKECNDTSKPIDPNLLTPGEYIESYSLHLNHITDAVVVQSLVSSCATSLVALLMFWWFRVTCVLPLVQLCYWCCGCSESLVFCHQFSCTTDVWWSRVTCVVPTSSVVLLTFGCSESLVSSCATSLVVLLMFGGVKSRVLCHQFSCATDVLVVQSHLCCATSSLAQLMFWWFRVTCIKLCHQFSCATDVWWFSHLYQVPPVQLCYWCSVVQSHLCQVQLCYQFGYATYFMVV